jgi:hypothetical protein
VHAGADTQEHELQVQLKEHVSVPYVLHGCVDIGVHP